MSHNNLINYNLILRNWLCNYTVSQKTVQNCFCQNFIKFPPILIIFVRKMEKRLKLCEVHSFSAFTASREYVTVQVLKELKCAVVCYLQGRVFNPTNLLNHVMPSIELMMQIWAI